MLRLIRRLALVLALVLAGPLALFPAALPARTTASARRPPVAAALPAPAARPALWKISDADTTIWLFGTIHALPPGLLWLDGPIAQALNGADELVTEIPETDPATMKSALLAHAMLPAGQSLRAQLSEADRAKFEQALASFGLPVDTFDRFEPWYAGIVLTTLPLTKSGYSAASGVDERLSAEVKARGRPRSGLETAETQIALFASLPADVQKGYLHEVLDSLPTIDRQLADIVREWQAGHPDKLAELLNAEEDDPRMVAVLLTNRNRNWAGWIDQRMKRPGVVFMAVGAGHLAGKDSVQDLLRRRGIKVLRVQ